MVYPAPFCRILQLRFLRLRDRGFLCGFEGASSSYVCFYKQNPERVKRIEKYPLHNRVGNSHGVKTHIH